MDDQTALVLALQLVALFSIAGALLLYLLCKIRASNSPSEMETGPGDGKAVLITCADTIIGIQIAVHLANQGFRVFAGLKDGDNSIASKIIRAWQKYRESHTGPSQGAIVVLSLDVTREDLLHEAVDIIRANLPAGKDGLWAVINTSGVSYRGRLDQQDISHWETTLRINVISVLRIARTFQTLLRNTKGRILNFGIPESPEHGDVGLVAYMAARYAVEGASKALLVELAPTGIKVVVLHTSGITPEMMYALPRKDNNDVAIDINGCVEFFPKILNKGALKALDDALTSGTSKVSYRISPKNCWFHKYRGAFN